MYITLASKLHMARYLGRYNLVGWLAKSSNQKEEIVKVDRHFHNYM